MAQMLRPLLGRVAIHTWLQGGTAWSLLVAREKPMAGMHRRRPSRREIGDGVMDDEGARVPAGGRTRGDIGLGGCAGNIAREGFPVPPKPPPNSVSAVFPKLPR